MQKNAAHTYAISSLLVLSLTGCAWIPSTPLVQGATSAQPVPGPTPVANGSIFQSAQPINYGYQPLFEDRRPRNIGDTLTIVLQENVSASKSSSANASRDGKTNFGFDTVPRYLQGLFGNARADVEADAPRDKCTLSCAINGIHAAFHYLKKNYISGCVMTVPTG